MHGIMMIVYNDGDKTYKVDGSYDEALLNVAITLTTQQLPPSELVKITLFPFKISRNSLKKILLLLFLQ